MKTDREIIETFECLTDDISLPIDPDDPEQLEQARQWARREYDHYDSELLLALGMPSLWPSDAAAVYRRDRDHIGQFYAALVRTLHAMRQRDQDRLAVWNSGEPIRDTSEEPAL